MWNAFFYRKTPQTVFLLALFAYLQMILYVRYTFSINKGSVISVSKHFMHVYLKGFINCCFHFSYKPIHMHVFKRQSNQYSIDFISWSNIYFISANIVSITQCINTNTTIIISLHLSPSYEFIFISDKATCTFRLTSAIVIKHHFICIQCRTHTKWLHKRDFNMHCACVYECNLVIYRLPKQTKTVGGMIYWASIKYDEYVVRRWRSLKANFTMVGSVDINVSLFNQTF